MTQEIPGIGHNSGPSGRAWQKHCWTKARKTLIGNTVPLEIVRIRVRRAQELGLTYPQYASVLLGGRDIVGFLFTVDGLQLRLRRTLEMPNLVKTKLGSLRNCDLLALSPSGEKPDAFQVELNAISGLSFSKTASEPEVTAGWSEARAAIRETLAPLGISGKSVVMIGGRGMQAQWAQAGKLAKFIPSADYFGT